ncbi:MAG: 30S ribosomal protein S16 [Candidatus Saccharimonadales bacterium]
MQRTGRKKHAMFRVVVQDSRRTPTSGKIVASLGSYDPHAKNLIIDAEKAKFYLDNGAQPSDRIVRLFSSEKISLPAWVETPENKKRDVRNAEKRRSTRPDEPVEAEEKVEPVEPEEKAEPAAEEPEKEAEAAEAEEPKAEESVAEEKTAEETPEPAEKAE